MLSIVGQHLGSDLRAQATRDERNPSLFTLKTKMVP